MEFQAEIEHLTVYVQVDDAWVGDKRLGRGGGATNNTKQYFLSCAEAQGRGEDMITPERASLFETGTGGGEGTDEALETQGLSVLTAEREDKRRRHAHVMAAF